MLKCNGCKKELSEELFYPNRHIKRGFQYLCKSCSNDYVLTYYRNNKEKMKEYNKKIKSTPEAKEKQREYRIKNAQRLKEYHAKWSKENRRARSKYVDLKEKNDI